MRTDAPEMNLPAGKTCKDCAHFERCRALISSIKGTEDSCDWSPSRFTQKPAEESKTVSASNSHAVLIEKNQRLQGKVAGLERILGKLSAVITLSKGDAQLTGLRHEQVDAVSHLLDWAEKSTLGKPAPAEPNPCVLGKPSGCSEQSPGNCALHAIEEGKPAPATEKCECKHPIPGLPTVGHTHGRLCSRCGRPAQAEPKQKGEPT